MSGKFPLTDFLVGMMGCETAKLAGASPEKLAARYGINDDHARGYIDDELVQRGHRAQKKAA